MSELSELIEINKNIENQNEEIIRLLKKIAGESENEQTITYVHQEVPKQEVSHDRELTLDVSLEVGEVYFIDNDDVFRLTVKNNEISVDNLSGTGECSDYSLAEIVANESIKNNQSLKDGTVILNDTVTGKLPQSLNTCISAGAKTVYLTLKQSMELLGAPQELITLINLEVYKNEEQLIGMLFED